MEAGATLNDSAGNFTIGQAGSTPLNGGSITNTGGGTFALGTGVTGYGLVSGVTLPGGANVIASGGTSSTPQILTFDGGTGVSLGSSSGSGATLSSTAFNTLDLKGTLNYINPGIIAPNGGTVQFDGVTLAANTWTVALSAGAVIVTNNSAMNGSFNSSATIGITSGKQLNVSTGPLTNTGAVNVGSGTLNNSAAGAYTLGGGGNVTLAGGSVTSTGGGGFDSNNTLRGYGTVSALYTNNGKVIADGGGVEQTLTMQAITPVSDTAVQGWFAQNHGKLVLPSVSVPSDGTYNWGGVGMVNSIAMILTGVTPGTQDISLLSPDRVDVPAGLTLPIGVWAFASGGPTFNSASMSFCYDSVMAGTVGLLPANMALWGYDGSQWNLIPTNPADTTNDLLTTASALPSFYVDFAIAQVPEPMVLSLLVIGGVGMLLRRRGV